MNGMWRKNAFQERPFRQSRIHRLARDRARHLVLLKRFWLAAEHVAGELVEHKDERERAFRRFGPVALSSSRSLRMNRPEPLLNGAVEVRILLEPLLRPGVPPERDHVRRVDQTFTQSRTLPSQMSV